MKRSVRRVSAIILFIVLMLSLAGFVIARSYLDPFVKNLLQDNVRDKSSGLYQLSIEKLRINLFAGTVRLYGISVQTDTVRLAEMRKGQPHKPAKIIFSADFAAIYHVHWWDYWKTKVLAVSDIEVQSPSVELTALKDSISLTDTTATLLERLPGLIAPIAKSITIGQVRVQNGQFLVSSEKLGRVTLQSADHIHLTMSMIRLSPQDTVDKKRPLYADDFSLDWKNYRLWTVGHRYLFGIGQAALSGQTLDVQDCTLRSVQGDSIKVADPPFRRPKFHFESPHVIAEGVDMYEALYHGAIKVGRLEIDKGALNISNNMNLALPNWRKMPNEAWRTLRVGITVDSLMAKNIDIVYRERVEDEHGTLTFMNSYVLAVNLSNDSTLMTDTTPVQLYATTQFMGIGDLSVALSIPLLSPNFVCPYRAVLRNMPLARINTLIVPKSNVRIDEGYAEEISVRATATNTITRGWVKIYYEGLKISVLTDDSTQKKRPLLSALANAILLRSGSEDKEEDHPYRAEAIAYRRMPEDGFLRLIWRAAQSALVKTLTTIDIKPKRNKDGAKKK